jgi:hypothetical protein
MMNTQRRPPVDASVLSTTCEIRKWMTIPRSELKPFERWATTPRAPKAAVANEDVCDVWRWAVVDVDEAIGATGRKRCIECQQDVKPRQSKTVAGAAHFEHVKRNPACSLSVPRRS